MLRHVCLFQMFLGNNIYVFRDVMLIIATTFPPKVDIRSMFWLRVPVQLTNGEPSKIFSGINVHYSIFFVIRNYNM